MVPEVNIDSPMGPQDDRDLVESINDATFEPTKELMIGSPMTIVIFPSSPVILDRNFTQKVNKGPSNKRKSEDIEEMDSLKEENRKLQRKVWKFKKWLQNIKA